MEQHYVKIEFACASKSELSDMMQWLKEELEETAIEGRFYEAQRTGAIGFGPYKPQDLVPFMGDAISLLYSEDVPVDVTSCRIYQRKKK